MASSIPDTLSFETHVKSLIEASEANIARIESQIWDLERLRDRERATVAQLRAAIAPVRKMPPELLAKIFRYTCFFDPLLKRWENWRNLVKQAQALSHVCAHWRQVAITTPRLWTDGLYIGLAETPTEAYCSGLKEWLRRSAPLPICVTLSCTQTVDVAAVFGALLTAAHRWSDVHFELSSISVFSDIPSDGLTQLRKLTLESMYPIPAGLVAFSLAPNLTEVSLETRHIAPLVLPWSQLTHLTVAVAESPQECLDGLLQCQNLVTADFYMPAWPGRPDVSELKPVTLGNLKVLHLKVLGIAVASITPFFACLALPALNRLALTLCHDLEWAGPQFTQFQLGSPNIEILDIGYSNLNSGDLMAILRHAPALTKLSLEACRDAFDANIVTALSSHQTTPRLHSLSITEGCDRLWDDGLDAMIAARWWTDEQLAAFPSPPQVSRWSYIYIEKDGEEDFNSELEATLDAYRRQGLNVDIY
ncbi:hypothetical protein C8R46DRAFT_331618 [Mycena filopes]|nr:hypothetical protein C8R46DRAFT_331618 [Mycena filopes]